MGNAKNRNDKNNTSASGAMYEKKGRPVPDLVAQFMDKVRESGGSATVIPPKYWRDGKGRESMVHPWLVCYADDKEDLEDAEALAEGYAMEGIRHHDVFMRLLNALGESDAPAVENRRLESFAAGVAIMATVNPTMDRLTEKLDSYVDCYRGAARVAVRDGLPFADCFIGTFYILSGLRRQAPAMGIGGILTRK